MSGRWFARKETLAWIALAAMGAVVFLSRLPFLDAGYGLHADGWRVAVTARQLVETGEYQYSRTPGFPVHEFACALLWPLRERGLNGLSAAAGAAAAVLLALYARRCGCRDWLLVGATLAFVPAFYISSVNAKDFTLTTALVLASFLFASRGGPLMSGVFLGLAIGARASALIFALPVALVLFEFSTGREAFRRIVRMALPALALAAVFYAPILVKFGETLFYLSNPLGYPPGGVVLHRGTVEVFGWPGLAGLVIAAIGILAMIKIRKTHALGMPGELGWQHQVAWWLMIAMTVGFFVWLPDQASYLTPALPFVLLVLARWTWRPLFQAACGLICLASFVEIGPGGVTKGPVAEDYAARAAQIDNIRHFINYTERLPPRDVVVVGSWEPVISILAPGREDRFAYLLPPAKLVELIREGRGFYYTPAIRQFELAIHGIDLAEYGGQDLRALFERDMRTKSNEQ